MTYDDWKLASPPEADEEQMRAECICDALRACEARVIGAAVQRVEALEYDPESGVDWNWDYDIDPTGMTRNPYVGIWEAVAAIKKVEQ